MTKIQMFQTAAVLEVANTFLFLRFGNLKFEFVSPNFIRWAILDFGFSRITILAHVPLGLSQNQALPAGRKRDPDFNPEPW
jgi:hypothetical protein